ncbi:MAG: GDSL family lipase [Candidatus Eremiobacteraeota bacterium]|nr:GDSL family lipase [Candidatus Eremiobacteraeota bacterium]MBV9409442.1 GDSL family lipase [Candidatus Eremiobacteraeota bacterium]
MIAAAPPAIIAQASPPASTPFATPIAVPPWIAAPRPVDAWLARHDGFVARAQAAKQFDVLFLGDSITDLFATRGVDAWNREVAPFGDVVDFGISGDRTQMLLWRVQHGELDGARARAIVLMIGTNNLASASAEDVARGVAAIVGTIRAKQPQAVVILLALLPRGNPGDAARTKVAAVNALIVKLADGTHVRWLDFGAQYLDADGTIPPALMPDKLHPSAAGYDIWATALRPALRDALAK